MSLAENLLNSLDETTYENMRIAGSGEEEHIIVGQDRSITVPNALKTIAVKGDKDVETATIDCVRYWDGNDLSTFAIYLNYILPNGDEGTYIPKSITKSVDFFTFDWQIGSEFTYSQGKLTFWIVAKLTDDSGTLVRQWSSFQNSDCNIAQGGDKIYVPEKQTDQDVISQAISISRASAETAEQQANLAKEAAEKAATDAREAAEDEVSRIIGELGVVQELGDSPNSVVSQAKVTKEFFNVNERVDRNSKEIENIKYGIPPEEFETDNSVSYQKDVPANALPYAEIHKIGGMTYKTKNLWDEEWENPSWMASIASKNHIPIKPDTAYYISANVSNGIFFYDENLATISTAYSNSFVTPANAKYMKFFCGDSYGKTYKGDIMLNEGTTALPYEPYFEGLRSAKVTEVKSVGVNLWDEQWFIDDKYLMSKNLIEIEPDTIYSLNISPANGIFFYDVNRSFVEMTYNTPFKTPKNAKYLRFAVGSSYGLVYKDDIILNKGSTALPYTPYFTETLPIPAAVQALDGWGQGIPDTDYYNFLDWRPEDGVTDWHEKAKKRVFDGTENWKLHNVDDTYGTSIFRLDSDYGGQLLSDGYFHILCNIYKNVNAEKMPAGSIKSSHTYNTRIYVAEPPSIATADEFKEKLQSLYAAGTPMEIVYTAIEKVTDISDLLPADNLISVEGGGTITFENEYGYAVPSEVEYQVEV